LRPTLELPSCLPQLSSLVRTSKFPTKSLFSVFHCISLDSVRTYRSSRLTYSCRSSHRRTLIRRVWPKCDIYSIHGCVCHPSDRCCAGDEHRGVSRLAISVWSRRFAACYSRCRNHGRRMTLNQIPLTRRYGDRDLNWLSGFPYS
jgi:hypothetical protein